MTSMTVIMIMAGALAVAIMAQSIGFLFILRSERRFTKDLLNRLASRTIGEYVQSTKTVEEQSQDQRPETEKGRPIPIFS